MTKTLTHTLTLLLIAGITFGQDTLKVQYKQGQHVFLTPDPVIIDTTDCKCKDGEDGQDGRGIVSTIVDPTTGIMTITYTDGTKYISSSLKGPKGEDGVCPTCPPSVGGSGGSDNTVNKIFNVVSYGATGNGSTDDRQAIQNAWNEAAKAKGTLYIPAPSNFYRINGTLNFKPVNANQAFVNVEGQGHWGFHIVYYGPSNQPAIIIDGLKAGTIRNLKVKIGDNLTGVVGFEIGTQVSGSTSGFSFYDCTVELNRGANNQGWRLGHLEGGGADISQILFSNCKVEGWSAGQVNGVQQHYPGQIGFNVTGHNTLALTWVGGATIFTETAVKLEQGGSLYFFGFQVSQNALDYHVLWANNIGVYGGRFEAGKKFLKVESMAAHPIVGVYNAMIEDYKPTDGNLIECNAPGTYIFDGVTMTSINRPFNSNMIKSNAPNGFGVIVVRGGKINASDPFYTGNLRMRVEDVVRVSDNNLQSIGFFTNR